MPQAWHFFTLTHQTESLEPTSSDYYSWILLRDHILEYIILPDDDSYNWMRWVLIIYLVKNRYLRYNGQEKYLRAFAL